MGQLQVSARLIFLDYGILAFVVIPMAKTWRAVRSKRAARASAPYHWPAYGTYETEAIGVQAYQGPLAMLAGDHGCWSAHTECSADLVPDGEGRDAPVQVRVQGQVVGLLAPEDASRLRRRLKQIGRPGATTTCDALVLGGKPTAHGRYLYGLGLDIALAA